MSKRQEPYAPHRHRLTWLILFLVTLTFLGACQQRPILTPSATAMAPSPTPTKQPEDTPTSTSTPATTSTTAPSITPAANCLEDGGMLQKGSYSSTVLESEFHYLVYLPPCYLATSGPGFPVMYLLHGLSYDNEQWLDLGLIKTMDALLAAGTIPPYIIVLPEESSPDAPQTAAYPEALITELIPWVDARYNTRPHRAYRGIGGVSRGAAWAVHIGFEHYQLFSRIGAHSLPLFQTDQGKLIGWMRQAPPDDQPKVLIDIGRNDQAWPSAKFFSDLLDLYAIPHEWYFFDGDHTTAYWSEHLEMYLTWYAQDW